MRRIFRVLAATAAVAVMLAAAAHPALAQAHNPFGVGISEGGGSASGITGWLLAEQAIFERQLSAAVKAARFDNHALVWLAGLSFLYGIFHAAGPGHGKAVMASYLFANERALRRGMVLTLLAALLQAIVAIVLVGLLALVLHATAQRMKDAASLVESLSYAGIALLGAWLVWRKGRRLVAALHDGRGERGLSFDGRTLAVAGAGSAFAVASADGPRLQTALRAEHSASPSLLRGRWPGAAGTDGVLHLAGEGVTPPLSLRHPPSPARGGKGSGQASESATAVDGWSRPNETIAARATPGARRGRYSLDATCVCGESGCFVADSGHDAACGHVHAPDPATLGDGFSWREAVMTVFAAGSRPCSGAILVLVFAIAQGLFAVGVASVIAMALGTAITTGALAALAVLAKNLAVRVTRPGTRGGLILIRALETAAAAVVLIAGLSLFLGYASLGGA